MKRGKNIDKNLQQKLICNNTHFTNFNKSLDSAGHGKLFTVCWTRLLSDCILWQPPSFLHHQFLGERKTDMYLQIKIKKAKQL